MIGNPEYGPPACGEATQLDFIRSIGGAISWLTASIAGLAALCYGAGYFALHAYLSMLGLDGIVKPTSDEMLTEGAQFWQFFFAQLLRNATYVVFLLLLVLLIGAAFWQSKWIQGRCESLRNRAIAMSDLLVRRLPQIGSIVALILLLLIVNRHYDTYFDALASLPKEQQLLFQTAPPKLGCSAMIEAEPMNVGATARDLILRGTDCRTQLESEFKYLLGGYFLLFLLMLLIFAKVKLRLSPYAIIVGRVVLGAYFAMVTLSLPPAYGILVHAPSYPLVAAGTEERVLLGSRLAQDNNSILLWIPATRTVQWLPVGQTKTIEIGSLRNIFEHPKEPRR